MRRHANPEPEIEADAAAIELQKTLNMLLPIRRQRLNRSERQQREQERALQQVIDKTAEGEVRLTQRQQDYQQIRQGFDGKNRGISQAKFRLDRALESEHQALERVDNERLGLHQLAVEQRERQSKVEQAQQETRLRMREMEKLEYLLQQEVLG
ncbi:MULTISPECIES: hypothetical protein [Erwinia]|uniref:hypothetical protein n=1 Tax=Erwinia TaxID=551 RepID=UPI0005537D2B|nr:MULTISPECIES: hypothetical protein [Erwinia]